MLWATGAPLVAVAQEDGGDPVGSGGCALTGTCVGQVMVGYANSGAGSGGSVCTYDVGSLWEIQARLPIQPHRDVDEVEPEGTFVLVWCPVGDAGVFPVDFFELGDPPSSVVVDRLAERALTVPVPAASFSPDEAIAQVVGLETWIWLDEAQTEPRSATACVGPGGYACVTVHLSFVSVAADMGDGSDVLDCAGAGTAYEPALAEADQRETPHCGHVYTDVPEAETYGVTVAAEWAPTWSCLYDADLDGVRETGCGGGVLPPLVRIAPPAPLEVIELQSVAVRTS